MTTQRQVTAAELDLDPIALGPDELVEGVVLLVRVLAPDGITRLVSRTSGGDWLVRRGMLDEALATERQHVVEAGED